MFLLGYNHKYKEPDNNELSEWGERVFQLISLILGNDRAKAQTLTIKVLNLWNQDILKEKKRAGKTRLYTQNPTNILKNRYHLLQDIVFYNLHQEEILQEKQIKLKTNSTEAQIHPWILILRFVKHVLKRTNKTSESRLVGICRILRHYKLDELQDIFERLIPEESKHHHNHFPNLQSKLFGDNENNEEYQEDPQNRLHERFKLFAELDDPRYITTIFKTISKDHPVVGWIEGHLNNLLSPWGANPIPLKNQNHKLIITAKNYLYTLGIKQIRTATDYCAADELRMLLITNPQFFEEFIVNSLHAGGEAASTKQVFRELQLPLMKNNTDENIPQSSPPDVMPWSAEEKLAALLSFSDSIKARKSGWLAESLILKVKDELIKNEQISKTTEFETAIKPTELIDFYIRKNDREILFYQLKIDFDELSESKYFEDNFTAEGGQTLTLQLLPEFQQGLLAKYNLSVKYVEPWSWKYRRFWLQQSFSLSLFNLSIGIKLSFAAILFLFVFLGLYFVFQTNNNISPIVISQPSPIELPNEVHTGNIKKEQPKETVKEELISSNKKNTNNSLIRNSDNKKFEKQSSTPEIHRKQPKQNSPVIEKTLPQTRPELAKNVLNSDEKLATSIFGNPSKILREPEIINQSGVSRNGSSNTKGSFLSPNETYVRPDNIKLSWSPNPEAVKYFIEIRNSRGKLSFSQFTTSANNSITLKNLPAGDNYFWSIAGIDSNDNYLYNLPEGNFSTLPDAALKRITAAEKQYANAPLLLGIVYMKNGLTDEAVIKFNEYAAKNPRSKYVRQLINRVEVFRAR